MHIGFDAKRAVRNFTGLGNYSRFIIEALTSNYPQNSYYLYSPKPPSASIAFPSNAIFRHPSSGFGSYWRSRGIVSDLKRDKIDVYHGLSNELPVGLNSAGIKSVVTVHDLIFLRYPQYYPWLDRKIYNLKFRHACKNADTIVAISEQTKKDIISFYGISEHKIRVVYQDCNEIFMACFPDSEKLRIREKYQLPEQFLLNVGTIETRKNLLLIVQALRELPENIELVVVGRETAYTTAVKNYIDQHNLGSRVHFLKDVAYADLPLIYQQAKIFVYPSRFEGFGIPIIEALHSGVPVIAATGSCLEEAGGSNSLYVNPDNAFELAQSVSQVFSDEGLRTKMIDAGRQHVRQFSADKISQQLNDIYHQVLNNA